MKIFVALQLGYDGRKTASNDPSVKTSVALQLGVFWTERRPN